jgi:outer membrane protein insertion porin family
MFGEVKLTERNFSYQGLTTLFSNGLGSLRGGGEYANLSFTLGTKTRRYALSWTKPFFMDTVWSIGFDIERSSSRYISDEYDIEATHFLLHAGYEMNAFMRFDCHYRFSNSHIPDGYKEKEQDSSIDGTVSAIGVTWIYDSTNAPVEPTEGFKSKADFEVAGLGGRHRFLKFTYLNSYYVPVGETGVLQVRADFKFIEPYGRSKPDSIPLDERFFLGGEETVRGYRPFSLGPKYKHDGNAPRGGISLQFYSIEYSLPVLSRAELFTFVDAGQLSLHRFHFGGLNVSAGYGGRFKVLPGAPPLTVGMGYPLNAKCNSDVKRFFITVGGRF